MDLSKGYFDAGDYVKYGQPAAFTVALLAWTGLEYEGGLHRAGQSAELRHDGECSRGWRDEHC